MNIIIYTRVSTKEQVEGYSLTYQESFCREYAERQGWNVVQVFQEQGESAKTANRTQLQKLLDYCQKNKGKVDILLVHKLDRFARNTADHQAVRAVLVRYGVKVRSVTEQIDDNSAGKFMENIFSAVAQFDNDVRSERTKAGMLEKLRQGHWPWKAPLGYKNS
ncbi:MAG TPA: recombinase family protein, partial [Candidatus Woesebacteria bacterium]|nr:recombinase family protein [Candidatus Woesebacteria bacterium]